MHNIKQKITDRITGLMTNQFWSQLFRNFLTALVGETGASALGFISTWLLVRMLGGNEYGILVLAQSYMTIVDTLINFQSWQAVTKYGAEALHEKDSHAFKCVLKYGICVDFITAAMGMIAAVVLIPLISHILKWEHTLAVCATIFSVEILFHFAGTSIGALRLLDRFKLVSIQKIITAAIKVILLIIVWAAAKSLVMCTIVYTMTDIFGHLLLTFFFLITIKTDKKMTLGSIFKEKDSVIKSKMIRFAVWTNLSSTVDVPVKELDTFILSSLSYEAVAVYKVFKQIGKVFNQLTTPLRQAILPQFANLVAENKKREGLMVVRRLKKSIYCILVPSVAVFALFAKDFLRILFGELYSQYWYVLVLFLVARIYALANVSIHSFFTALGYVKETFIYSMISNIIYLGFMFLLVNRIGIMGAVISLFIQYLIILNLKYYKIHKTI